MYETPVITSAELVQYDEPTDQIGLYNGGAVDADEITAINDPDNIIDIIEPVTGYAPYTHLARVTDHQCDRYYLVTTA